MSAFHAGERAIQQRAGFGDAVLSVGERFIRGALPEQHQAFFAQLPFVLLGVLDAQGVPRAGLLTGAPGFMSAVDDAHLEWQGDGLVGEGLAGCFAPGAQLGLLGIEAHTRRRNRANGVIVGAGDGRVRMRVTQSFGNCPKYIHPRRADLSPLTGTPRVMQGWDEAARRIVAAADTFYIATAHPEAANQAAPAHGVDVSHRGGEAGFVEVIGNTLSVLDYPGNRFFNTLGNLELNPQAGLLFIDYTSQSLLQLAVRAQIDWLPAPDEAPTRPGRMLRFEVVSAERTEGGLPLVWTD
ncbi:pyridoxamine 5'-phosphate oxidase family protein [Denitromonas ohlonensis]|uniref:Flavin-nucleotide-binding protein n=2 Tax=Denitromonas TaxID=139331 RepID=A0A557S655_9RHOO|nr:pyridoxamine 5'-phosphate oxidase family protein [Denitromonas ohlonensis]TVO68766.1 flavin-nucleotide-binding protein [Denitromonas ohlonensis]TVO72868.1 flavin-nucleotide-binding protein [Denitromonas ohlonensis]